MRLISAGQVKQIVNRFDEGLRMPDPSTMTLSCTGSSSTFVNSPRVWYGRVSDNPVTSWFNALSKTHPVGSALLQSTLVSPFFILVVGAAVQFKHGWLLAMIGVLLWTVLLTASPKTVYPEVAKFSHVCAYDRPGTSAKLTSGLELTASTPVPQPVNAQGSAADLDAVLTASGRRGPFVLVGQCYGGIRRSTPT
jgi:hypothetical protein